MNYVGIDPGKAGAIAIIWESGLVEVRTYPKVGLDINVAALAEIFKSISTNSFCVLEGVTAIRGQKVASQTQFEFGETLGLLRMGLVMAGIPFKPVPPKEWQKWAFSGIKEIRGTDGARDTKAMAHAAVMNMFPNVKLTDPMATARATKPHTGVVDALLLAAYARTSMNT